MLDHHRIFYNKKNNNKRREEEEKKRKGLLICEFSEGKNLLDLTHVRNIVAEPPGNAQLKICTAQDS